MGTGYRNSLRKIIGIAGDRKLILWGTDFLSMYVYEDLKNMGYDIPYFVSDTGMEGTICGKEIKQTIELMYENIEEIFIVAFVLQNHGTIYQKLLDMGFVFEKDFLLYGFGGYMQKFDVIDSLLGYNRYYEGILGFQITGNQKKNSFKIMILGGSTTDPTMGNNMPWADFLYKKLKEIYPDVTVYNGGMAGYSTSQEFYKFVRDGLILEPDMIITYDGLNDVGCMATDPDYPFLTPYGRKVFDYIEKKGDFAPDTLEIRNASSIVHGLSQRSRNDADRWTENIRKIHAVAEEFGITHIGFMQPMLMTGKAIISERQRELIKVAGTVLKVYQKWMDEMPGFYQRVLPFIEEKEYLYDLSNIFDEEENIYYDFCHVTDKGNKIIADAIYEKIITYL